MLGFFLSRPIILYLYREKTQIMQYAGSETILIRVNFLEYIIILMFSSFSYNRDMPYCSEIIQIKEYFVA